ncbi:ankyrin repeat domain-containing protein 50 [Microdochium nivale]|nr:ankyrin repeat domain-containing protein 50 [Microdochium nivale]
MSELIATTLSSASARISTKARTTSDEIEKLLSSRSSETIKNELDKLSLLSTSLRQLEHHAGEIPRQLQSRDLSDAAAASLSDDLGTAFTAALPVYEQALAFVSKEASRLGQNTPRQRINVAAISRFDAFVHSTTALYLVLRQLLSLETEDVQALQLKNAETQRTLARSQQAARDTGRDGGILSDTASPGTPNVTSSNLAKKGASTGNQQGICGELPPYSGTTTSFSQGTSEDTVEENSNNKANAGGFLDSLSNSFRALTSAMRFKPEPFVVPLCEAATQGSIPQIQGLLDAGVNINGHNDAGLTALICAIRAHQIEAARHIINAGADPKLSASGRKGRPPLFHAVDVQSESALDLLLASGVSMTSNDSWFLDLLTSHTSPGWVALLLSRGANVHAKDSTGRVAIALTIQNRKKKEDADEVVITLLAHGADANARDLYGTPITHLCLQQGRDSLLSRLLDKGANVNGSDLYGNSLIIEALKRSNVALVKALIARGVDVNSTDIYGNPVVSNLVTHTMLSAADKENILELLAQRSVRCGTTDAWGVQPLDHAVASVTSHSGPLAKSERRIIELIISHGADVNQRLTKQAGYPTLLTYAVDRQDWELFRATLDNGADPNHADTKGRTPLLMALQHGKTELVSLLIGKGADVNQAGQVTPADMARATQDPELMQMMGVSANDPLQRHSNDREVPASQVRALLPTLLSNTRDVDLDLPPQYESNPNSNTPS